MGQDHSSSSFVRSITSGRGDGRASFGDGSGRTIRDEVFWAVCERVRFMGLERSAFAAESGGGDREAAGTIGVAGAGVLEGSVIARRPSFVGKSTASTPSLSA